MATSQIAFARHMMDYRERECKDPDRHCDATHPSKPPFDMMIGPSNPFLHFHEIQGLEKKSRFAIWVVELG